MSKHPSHPIAVHFPIAFWITASLCDLAGNYNESIWEFGGWCLLLGCASSLPALATGLWQLNTTNVIATAETTINWHVSSASTAFALYLTTLLLRLDQGELHPPSLLATCLSSSALLPLLFAGWLGGSMVYGQGIGVSRQEENAS